MHTPYTGRLAPSPTGLLHLGHAATFLVARDRARAAGGKLLLRFDDLDPQRSQPVFFHATYEDLAWLGIHWDAELRQSQRLSRYKHVMVQLLQSGQAYPCSCSRKDLQQAVEAPHDDSGDEPVYSGRCRPTHAVHTTRLVANTNYRLRVPDGTAVAFADGNCGPQRFIAGEDFGDFLVWRRDGLPSYQLASVVDDADEHISEVVRGRDLLKSTARQLLLQRALHLPTPAYFHTELLRDAEGRRLAKRDAALTLQTLRREGVTPDAVRARVAGFLHHKPL